VVGLLLVDLSTESRAIKKHCMAKSAGSRTPAVAGISRSAKADLIINPRTYCLRHLVGEFPWMIRAQVIDGTPYTRPAVAGSKTSL